MKDKGNEGLDLESPIDRLESHVTLFPFRKLFRYFMVRSNDAKIGQFGSVGQCLVNQSVIFSFLHCLLFFVFF